MKKAAIFLLNIFMLFSALDLSEAKQKPSKGYVNNMVHTRLRVRKKPNFESEIKSYLYFGNEVEIIKSYDKWYKIKKSDNSKGWVFAQYITVTEKEEKRAARKNSSGTEDSYISYRKPKVKVENIDKTDEKPMAQ